MEGYTTYQKKETVAQDEQDQYWLNDVQYKILISIGGFILV